MPKVKSVSCFTAFSIRAQKLGQPVPLSNLVSEAKSGSSQPAQTNVPWRCSLFRGLVKGRSVSASRNTANCSGVSSLRHSSGVFVTSNVSVAALARSRHLKATAVAARAATAAPPRRMSRRLTMISPWFWLTCAHGPRPAPGTSGSRLNVGAAGSRAIQLARTGDHVPVSQEGARQSLGLGNDLRGGNDDLAAHALGRKGQHHVASERAADHVLDHGPAEARALRRNHRRAALLLPDEFQLGGLLAELPLDTDLALRLRQRAVFLGVRGKLVQGKAEILDRLGLQHDVFALDGDACAKAVGMLAELPLDQHTQGRAVPIVGDEKVVGGTHRRQPGAEAGEKIVDRARARGGLPRDGLGDGEQILAAMREFAQQKAKLVLVGLALADIDGDRRGADNGAMLVPQRLDHEIEGPLPP